MSDEVRRYMFDARAGTLSRYDNGAKMILSADGEVVPASDFDRVAAQLAEAQGRISTQERVIGINCRDYIALEAELAEAREEQKRRHKNSFDYITSIQSQLQAMRTAVTDWIEIRRRVRAARLESVQQEGTALADWKIMSEEQIKHMVNRFLGWRLPEAFSPDAGISFNPDYNVEYNAARGKPPARHQPTGTNLFDATQAEAMVRYMLEQMPGKSVQQEGGER